MMEDLEYLEVLDEDSTPEPRKRITKREGFVRLDPTTKQFRELDIGDLFEVAGEQYRKIPLLLIPEVGERNAAKEPTQHWMYFLPETVTVQYGHVDLEVDRVRAKRQITEMA
jgi:hypothetical protein